MSLEVLLESVLRDTNANLRCTYCVLFQIKSLLGHRSQAAPEVRLVSGRHLKEFCEFLQSKPEYFVVEGDRVRLKNLPEPTEEVVELDDEGRPLAGVKAKQAAVDFLRGVLEKVSANNGKHVTTSRKHFRTKTRLFHWTLSTSAFVSAIRILSVKRSLPTRKSYWRF